MQQHNHLIGGNCQQAAAFNSCIFLSAILLLGGGAAFALAKSI